MWSSLGRIISFEFFESSWFILPPLVPFFPLKQDISMKRAFAFALAVIVPLVVYSAEEGFTPLFDGKSLDGWQGGKDGYEIKDGAIVSLPKGSGNLLTDKE